MIDEDTLHEALDRSHPPWTVTALKERASDPTAFKHRATLCTDCDMPCKEEEVCAAAVAEDVGLLDETERYQAFRLIESAVKRLEIRDEAAVRTAGDRRPCTFVSLE